MNILLRILETLLRNKFFLSINEKKKKLKDLRYENKVLISFELIVDNLEHKLSEQY